MAQHFLLSARARSLSIAQVLRMTDEDAERAFAALRWAETGGKAVCPSCGCPTCYECRRPSGALRYRCKACRGDFSLTSGTLFAFHKLPLRTYLAAVVIFCNEVKGKSALALSRDLGVQYKTAFVLAHKLREAMATEMRGAKLGGKGAVVEVDGGYFGGYVKPANHKENRRDRRKAGARWGTTTTSPGRTSCATPKRARGGRITAGTATGVRSGGWSPSPCTPARAWTSAVTGNGRRRVEMNGQRVGLKTICIAVAFAPVWD